MIKIKNIFTDVEYESIRYDEYKPEQVQKCKRFITDKLNLNIRVVMPKLYVFGLEHVDYEAEISPTDYIIRRLSDKRMFNVISEDIFKSNFVIE